jgi:hypothetical protein
MKKASLMNLEEIEAIKQIEDNYLSYILSYSNDTLIWYTVLGVE